MPVDKVSISDLPVSCSTVLRGHSEAVLKVKFSSDGDYCMSAGQDRSIRLWNPSKGLFIKEYNGFHNREIFDLAISGDNSRFASVGGDKIAFLCDITTGNVIRKFIGHNARINTCGFNRNENLFITGSHDQTVKIWDLRAFSKLPVESITDFKDSVTCLQVKDFEILTGSVDGHIRNYDIRKGCLTVDNLYQPIVGISLSNENDCILASCMDSCVRLLDKDTGELISLYVGHKNENFQIGSTLDVNDSYVVSGSEDNKIYFWDLVLGSSKNKISSSSISNSVLHSHSAHDGPIFCVTFHPKSDKMLSCSADKSIKLWEKVNPS